MPCHSHLAELTQCRAQPGPAQLVFAHTCSPVCYVDIFRAVACFGNASSILINNKKPGHRGRPPKTNAESACPALALQSSRWGPAQCSRRDATRRQDRPSRLERELEKREDKTMLAANIYTIPATFSSTNAICRHGPCISVHLGAYYCLYACFQ